MSFPARPLIWSAADEPVRVSAPPAPVRVMVRLDRPVSNARLTLVADAAVTARVSVPPPAVPLTAQAWPLIWLPSKVAVTLSARVTASTLERITPVRSVLTATRSVSVPVPASTVSPEATSEVPE